MSGPTLVKAIRDALLAESDITDVLETYDFGGVSEEPAIFDIDPVPEDADLPAMTIVLAAGSRWGVRAFRGAEMVVDVHVWDAKEHSSAAIRRVAWTIWETLNRASLSLGDYDEVGCQAQPPRTAPDPDGFPGYLVEVFVRLLER